MSDFNEKLNNYNAVATGCVLRAERMIKAVNAHIAKTGTKRGMEGVLAELLYNYRREIIEEQQTKLQSDKSAFIRGLQSAVDKAIDQYYFLTNNKNSA